MVDHINSGAPGRHQDCNDNAGLGGSAVNSGGEVASASPKNSVEMGWGAPPIHEQHPILEWTVAVNFDEDNAAISRLLLRGLITQSQADAARKKYVAKVATAIKSAIAKARGEGL
jgi:hypothetical protein